MPRKSWLFALLLVFCLAPPLAAQVLEAGPKSPVFATSGDGVAPAVASGPDGGFAVVWLRKDGSLAARVFASSGAPAGPEHILLIPQTISTNITIGAGFWSLAAHPDGYVAVWEEVKNSDYTFSSRSRFQRLEASDGLSGPVRDLDTLGSFSPFSVTVDQAGMMTILWNERWFLYAQRFDEDGDSQGSLINLADDPTLTNEYFAAALPDGGFVMMRNNARAQITVRLLRPDGTPVGADVAVHAADRPAARDNVVLASSPSGHFVVAWKETESAPQIQRRLLARLFGPSGQPLTPEIVVASATGETKLFLMDAAVRLDGSFLIDWTLGPDLLASAFDADGNRIGSDLTSDRAAVDGGFEVDAVATPGGWLSTWSANAGNQNSSGPWFQTLTFACAASGEPALCLNGNRFRLEVSWRVPGTGQSGTGTPIPLTGETGAFWFFDPANYELAAKVLDGRGVNGHFWVFYASLTDVEFDLTVTDTVTGEQRTYHNPAGTMASRSDVLAF